LLTLVVDEEGLKMTSTLSEPPLDSKPGLIKRRSSISVKARRLSIDPSTGNKSPPDSGEKSPGTAKKSIVGEFLTTHSTRDKDRRGSFGSSKPSKSREDLTIPAKKACVRLVWSLLTLL
jgi:hypothetical protein